MTVTTIQIHPLLTGNASLTAHLDIRSVYDILPDIDMSTNYFTSLDKATHFLNHAPVFLRYENGGEELLNRDCIKEQLNLDESLKSPLPPSLYVFIIEEHDLKVSTRVIRFVYAQLQILMYRKTDGNAVDLRKKAVDELANNSELNGRSQVPSATLLKGARTGDGFLEHLGVNFQRRSPVQCLARPGVQ
ncbi:hypothetical protein [Halomonas piscis]|uniref:hypothetical protein n=1 Tax=Halomonas piscis TaxID=3031727 RepID=UPI0028970E7A|nr:hypothetical protein [Halomonas piscis]